MADDGGVFERFVAEVEPRLRRALIATYGDQVGQEAALAGGTAPTYRARGWQEVEA